ncbi:MAG TPA: hypothetical protein VND64_21935, partial [Pirellulales bacterium]|nr:hypothetical protein [Pirellulales bacterium]
VERRVVVRYGGAEASARALSVDTSGAAWLRVRQDGTSPDDSVFLLRALPGGPEFVEGELTIRLDGDPAPYFLRYVGFNRN